MNEFKSMKRVKEASMEQLAATVGKAKAKIIYDYSRKND